MKIKNYYASIINNTGKEDKIFHEEKIGIYFKNE